MRPTLDHERRLWTGGHRWVAGMDEVGRGAWAGPVSVGVAVVGHRVRARTLPVWLRDSKQLAEERRDAVFWDVADWCADGAVGHATAAECDRWGMTAALRLAAHRALAALELQPDALLLDGPFNFLRPRPARPPGQPPGPVPDPLVQAGDDLPELLVDDDLDRLAEAGTAPDLLGAADGADPELLGTAGGVAGPPDRAAPDAGPLPLPAVAPPSTVVPVVGGDGRCAAVAAASVLAKVVRDQLMREEAEHFPAYCFERNKGYPSPTHRMALRGYGLSAIHRRSWAFVADLPWR